MSKKNKLKLKMPGTLYVSPEMLDDDLIFLARMNLDDTRVEDGDIVYVYELKAKATVDKASPKLRNVEPMKR